MSYVVRHRERLIWLILIKVGIKKLANSKGTSVVEGDESGSSRSKRLVVKLYEALNSGDSDTVVNIVAPQLEWWFHGPPSHQFLMQMLTGTGHSHSNNNTFRFVPDSITCFGNTVLVEGCDNNLCISWVHAWTLTDDGIITQVREYFNTSLTVTRFDSDSDSDSDSEITTHSHSHSLPCLWESTLSNRVGKSVPGLVLALWLYLYNIPPSHHSIPCFLFWSV